MNDEIHKQIKADCRHYWTNENLYMSEGDQWYVHTYVLKDVDDFHVLTEYNGRNSHGDFVFKDVESPIYSNQLYKFDKTEMLTMIFKTKTPIS
jgi:hypothetical protein